MLDLEPIKAMLRAGQVTNAHTVISHLVAEVEHLRKEIIDLKNLVSLLTDITVRRGLEQSAAELSTSFDMSKLEENSDNV